MISVTSKVRIYEVDGEDTGGLDAPALTVKSHSVDMGSVVLLFGDKRITVRRTDLDAAVANACNSARF